MRQEEENDGKAEKKERKTCDGKMEERTKETKSEKQAKSLFRRMPLKTYYGVFHPGKGKHAYFERALFEAAKSRQQEALLLIKAKGEQERQEAAHIHPTEPW